MKTTQSFIRNLTFITLVAALPTISNAQTYHVTRLSALPGTSSIGCYPSAINDSGVVVGACYQSNIAWTAASWTDGAPTNLGKFAKGHYAGATAINSLGRIVGDADMGDYQPKPFLATPTGLLSIDSQGGSNVRACGIMDNGVIFGNFTSSGSGSTSMWTPVYWVEDATHPGRYKRTSLPKVSGGDPKANIAYAERSNKLGQVVGNVVTSLIGQHGAFWNNDAAHSVVALDHLPGGNQSLAYALNDLGQAVGESTLFSGQRATLWDNDAAHTPIDLGTLPGDIQSNATGINTAGQIVGWSGLTNLAGQVRGFVYQNGVMQDLASLIDPADGVWTVSDYNYINNAGQITTVGTSGGQSTLILLTPIAQ
jgi:probable extracellular repeat, HAF family